MYFVSCSSLAHIFFCPIPAKFYIVNQLDVKNEIKKSIIYNLRNDPTYLTSKWLRWKLKDQKTWMWTFVAIYTCANFLMMIWIRIEQYRDPGPITAATEITDQ